MGIFEALVKVVLSKCFIFFFLKLQQRIMKIFVPWGDFKQFGLEGNKFVYASINTYDTSNTLNIASQIKCSFVRKFQGAEKNKK